MSENGHVFRRFAGVYTLRATPVPIPNTEVKPQRPMVLRLRESRWTPSFTKDLQGNLEVFLLRQGRVRNLLHTIVIDIIDGVSSYPLYERFQISREGLKRMKDASINFYWNGVPCCCRCRHCFLHSGGKVSSVRYEDARLLVEKFINWRDTQQDNKPEITFGVGYSCDFPQLVEHVEFCSHFHLPGSDFLQAGGWKIKTGTERKELLSALRRSGVTKLGLSFYGIGKSHDDFAGRKNYFDYLLRIARAAAECDLCRYDSIFLRNECSGELPALLDILENIPGCCGQSMFLFDYRGRGKSLEDQRPTQADINDIPAHVLKLLNLQTYKTEKQWVQAIARGDIPEKASRHYFIPIWDDDFEELKKADPDHILSQMRKADDRFSQSMPPLAEIAVSFADPDGKKMYALRDLQWKWEEQYLKEHPEMDASGRFDDLALSILKK